METETITKRTWIPDWKWLLLVGLLVVIFACGFVVWTPFQREQAAIAEIERLGGRVLHHGGPGWLREIVGHEWMTRFDDVVLIDLTYTKITDDGLKHLRGMTNFTQLYLGGTDISDDGLKHLYGLKNLNWLYLTYTKITDDGLKHLIGLSSLKLLYLENTNITAAGAKSLERKLTDCNIRRKNPYIYP